MTDDEYLFEVIGNESDGRLCADMKHQQDGARTTLIMDKNLLFFFLPSHIPPN